MVRLLHFCLLCWWRWCRCLWWWWACRHCSWYGDVIVGVQLQVWALRVGLQRCPRWTRQNKPAECAKHCFSVPAGDINRWAEFRVSPRIIKIFEFYLFRNTSVYLHKNMQSCALINHFASVDSNLRLCYTGDPGVECSTGQNHPCRKGRCDSGTLLAAKCLIQTHWDVGQPAHQQTNW